MYGDLRASLVQGPIGETGREGRKGGIGPKGTPGEVGAAGLRGPKVKKHTVMHTYRSIVVERR